MPYVVRLGREYGIGGYSAADEFADAETRISFRDFGSLVHLNFFADETQIFFVCYVLTEVFCPSSQTRCKEARVLVRNNVLRAVFVRLRR